MSANPTIGQPFRPDEIAPGEHYWTKVSRDLRHRLNAAVPHETLKELHRKSPARHIAVAIRQFALLLAAYAVPSGLSALQFTRWHLTHHAELGDPEADPKRHYLSPKINRPWFKLLYFTPVLFPIYFRAARRETASYPPSLQRRIARERIATILLHLVIMGALFWIGGFGVLARVYLVPYFLVFPVAFALNRLGQHYAIDPEDPAKWGTVLRPSRWWD